MFSFKRDYRPIQGQRWWERMLDIITREYPLNQIETIVNFLGLFGMFAILALRKVLETAFPRQVTLVIVWGEVGLVFLWLLLSAIEWIGNRVERAVKRRVSKKIEQYVTEHIACSYDDLIGAVMKVRIHRGFDEALANFENERKLSVCAGICRLPTAEDKERWRAEDVDLYGVSFETLEQTFAHPLTQFGGELRIEFSVWENEVHRLEKERDTKTNTELYVCTVAGGNRREFSSFAELADTPLFDGKNLREVSSRICVSYANGFSWPPEFFELDFTPPQELDDT